MERSRKRRVTVHGVAVRPSSIPKLVRVYSKLDRSHRPALLFLGPPGIGKTAMVAAAAAELAREAGLRLVDLSGEAADAARALGVDYVAPAVVEELKRVYEEVRQEPEKHIVFMRLVATHVTPEDLQYPRLSDGYVVNAAPVKIAFFTIPGVRGILFIDEITNVKDDAAKTMFYSIVHEGSIGLSGSLSRQVIVVAAGNTREESEIVEPLPAPLVNRFAVYRVEPPTVDEVIEYIERYVAEPHPAVVSYLAKTGVVYEKPPAGEGLDEVQFPTPRSWARLASILTVLEREAPELMEPTVYALLGASTASSFITWLRVKPPDPSSIYSDPNKLADLDDTTVVVETVLLARYAARFEGNAASIAEMIKPVMLALAKRDLELVRLYVRVYRARAGRKAVEVLTLLSRDRRIRRIVSELFSSDVNEALERLFGGDEA